MQEILAADGSSAFGYHLSGLLSNAALAVLTHMYEGGGHSVTLSNSRFPFSLHYSRFKAIAEDIDDARVYGGIHFRFDQEGGARQGKGIALYVLRNALRRLTPVE